MKEREEQLRRIQEVLDRKKKERLEHADYMYQKGIERMQKEQKEDNSEEQRAKHIEDAENKAYKQWEEKEAHRQQQMQIIQASRQALIQRRKNDKEQERSIERNVAEMIKMRNMEIDAVEANDKEVER